MEKRLDDSDAYIVSLQEKIKALVTEKETLLQAKKALEEDKEQYQVMLCNRPEKLSFLCLSMQGLLKAFSFVYSVLHCYISN